ncbi:MAG: alpha/beta hydrolase [Mycoplasmoidaceae bacterium]|nr:MAG: alpha/beta hydrolase [Mycoplasmoidaceae bacterium]
MLHSPLFFIYKFGMWSYHRLHCASIKKISKYSTKSHNFKYPPILSAKCDICELEINGCIVYTITSKNVRKFKVNNAVLYIHGGGFINEISNTHWNFIKKLAIDSEATIYVPIYPLSKPEYSPINEIFSLLKSTYEKVITDLPSSNVTIMGDSAGGNLALALGQELKQNGLPKPKNLILISPMLDMSENSADKKKDAVISKALIRAAEKWYLVDKKKNGKNFMYSPYYGDSSDIGYISLYVGSNEWLYPSCKNYNDKLNEEGITHDFVAMHKFFHDALIFSMPETKKYFSQIISKITK